MITRRRALGVLSGTVAAAVLNPPALLAQAKGARVLTLGSRVLEVHGKAATVLGIANDSAGTGLNSGRMKAFASPLRTAWTIRPSFTGTG